MEYLINIFQSIYQGWILNYVLWVKYFKKKNKMEQQRRKHIHLKHFPQHTINLEALVKRKPALATAILFMYLVKDRITMELLKSLKSQSYFSRSLGYLYKFQRVEWSCLHLIQIRVHNNFKQENRNTFKKKRNIWQLTQKLLGSNISE